MKQIIALLFIVLVSCSNEKTKSESESDSTEIQNTGSDQEKNVMSGSKNRQEFVTSCLVNADMGQGLDAGRKKIFCDCLWEESGSSGDVKASDNQACMEKVQKMGQ